MHLAWLWPDTTSKTIKDIKTWCLINSVIGLTNLLERSFTWTRNSQQNVCTRKGKYPIRLPKRDNIIVIGSNLCSKDIIQYDSFAFIFLIIIFLLYYIFITLLFWIVNSGLPKKKVSIDVLKQFLYLFKRIYKMYVAQIY